MKIKTLLIIGFLVSAICCSQSHKTGVEYYDQLDTLQINSGDVLKNIQSKVYNAFVGSITGRDLKPIETVHKQLKEAYSKSPNNLLLYWKGYLFYYKAIYHIRLKEEDKSEQAVTEGIDILQNIERKNSEDFALLALLKSFSQQFHSGFQAGKVSADIERNVKHALELDPDNLRAHYVYASNDFYTPKKYGGGLQAEKHLLKAISLPAQKISNPYLPSWGKEEAYTMLIQLYINEENFESAKKYYKKGMEKYPDSYSISRHAQKLIDK